MVEVVATDEMSDWYASLFRDEQNAVDRSVDLLELEGPTLGHPYSSAIKGTSTGLRELRVQSKGRPIRVFYAFDPRRQAVLLIGGDKTGDDRFYERMVPRAERILSQFLVEQTAGLHVQEEEP